MAIMFVHIHPSKAERTLLREGNCFVIASTVRTYSLWQMLLNLVAEIRNSLLSNALYHHSISMSDIACQAIYVETYPNMRQQFKVT